ncbi:MAG: dihydrolipoyl dehydrogenase [Synergistaceae bacterium]|jgi:dihydrolipoamide dehydrogenase|nr:dihydrolipoyl dehydrogenase [Synergistaceae bacterium]
MEKSDLIILGGGPAGYAAAERASAGGLSVTLFEGRSLGGVCLNEGCIPTKSMLYSAKLLDGARHGGPYGVRVDGVSLDHAAVMKRKNKVVKALVAGIAAKMKAHGVTVVPRNGTVTGKTLSGFAVTDGEREYEASRLLICTGSEPVIPPIPGVAEGIEAGFVLTSREALELTDIPKELVIVGGGAIGLEMAGYFRTAGSRVTVVEMLDKIAGPAEAEISKILLGNLRQKGIEFKLGHRVTGVTPGKSVTTDDGVIDADKVLLTIGRKPRTAGAGLEALGVFIERGAVATDRHMRTNVPNIYAAGDVNGRIMLAHTAYREAEAAVNHMLGRADSMRYDAIPSVIYTSPEAACVGETEESAAARGLQFKTAKLSMRYAGRYMAENEGGDGICKLVADGRDGRLLGVHMIGGYASEIIFSAAMMIESRLPADSLKKLIFPHPTVGEIIRELLFEI